MIAASHILAPDTRSIDWRQPVNWSDPLNDGLVSWWLAIPNHTSGTSTWRDLCGKNDGTLTNFANVDQAWQTQGQAGGFGALEFDGTDDHVAADSVAALSSDVGTIAFFVAVDVDDGGENDVVSISNNASSTRSELRLTADMRSGGDFIRPKMVIDGSTKWAAYTALDSLDAYVGRFLSVTVVQDGEQIACYFDGKPISLTFDGTAETSAWISDLLAASSPATCMTFAGTRRAGSFGGWSAMGGRISDVRIWSRALTASEIQDYYHRSQRYYPGLLNRHARRSVFVPSTGTTITPATLSISAALQGSPPVSSRTIEVT